MDPTSQVKNFVAFQSLLADEAIWSFGRVQPPGVEHARLLRGTLTPFATPIDGPWHQAYAWEFWCKVDRISFRVLVGDTGGGSWLVTVKPAFLFTLFLRRERVRAAQEKLANAIEIVLACDSRFHNIHRYSQAEFRSVMRRNREP